MVFVIKEQHQAIVVRVVIVNRSPLFLVTSVLNCLTHSLNYLYTHLFIHTVMIHTGTVPPL